MGKFFFNLTEISQKKYKWTLYEKKQYSKPSEHTNIIPRFYPTSVRMATIHQENQWQQMLAKM